MSGTDPARAAAPLRLAVIGVGGMSHWQHLPNLRARAARARTVALGFCAELEHFFGCVRQGAVPLTSGPQALATQRLVYRIYRQAGLAMP